MITNNNLLLYKKILPKLSGNAFYTYWNEIFTYNHLGEPGFVALNDNSIVHIFLGNGNGPKLECRICIIHYFFDFSKNKVFDKKTLQDPLFLQKLDFVSRYIKNSFLCSYDIHVTTNFYGFDFDVYQQQIFDSVETLLYERKINHVSSALGSFDILLNQESNYKYLEFAFQKLFNQGALTIELNPIGAKVNNYFEESVIDIGVSKKSQSIYEPIYTKQNNIGSIISEFEKLINQSPNEKILEDFISAYYREIFGFKYDRIETQLWLRFPDIDICNKNRRIDIFLRNSIISDWELFELKRSSIKLTSTYRDAPDLSKEIYNSIRQLDNYYKLLSQDKVRNQLKNEGIEYYEPKLNLVIGNKPQISVHQWRNLLSTQSVNILTYDNLLRELESRYKETNSLYDDYSRLIKS